MMCPYQHFASTPPQIQLGPRAWLHSPGMMHSTAKKRGPIAQGKCRSPIPTCRLGKAGLEGSADSDGASAVDRQFDSCDKPGRVAREIQRGVSDVFGCRHPSQRNAGDDPGAALRRIRAAKKLLDQTRRAHDRTYRVDSNVVGTEL